MQMKHAEEHPVIIKVIFYFYFSAWYYKMSHFNETQDSYSWNQSHCEWTFPRWPSTSKNQSPFFYSSHFSFFPSVYLSLPLSCSLSSFFVPLYTSLCPSPWIARNQINRRIGPKAFAIWLDTALILGFWEKKIFMPDILEYVSGNNPTIMWQKVGRKVQLCFHQRGKKKKKERMYILKMKCLPQLCSAAMLSLCIQYNYSESSASSYVKHPESHSQSVV